MGSHAQLTVKGTFALDLSDRGFGILFHRDESRPCIGCGRHHWLVGSVTAECASCGSALPLDASDQPRFDPRAQKAVALHWVEGGKSADAGYEKRADERVPADGKVLALMIDGSPRAFSIVRRQHQ